MASWQPKRLWSSRRKPWFAQLVAPRCPSTNTSARRRRSDRRVAALPRPPRGPAAAATSTVGGDASRRGGAAAARIVYGVATTPRPPHGSSTGSRRRRDRRKDRSRCRGRRTGRPRRFFFGIVKSYFSLFLLGRWPEMYPAWTAMQFLIILPIHAYRWTKSRSLAFFTEFCWCANFTLAVYVATLYLRPDLVPVEIRPTMTMAYIAVGAGPLGSAVMLLGNALVPHSIDHMMRRARAAIAGDASRKRTTPAVKSAVVARCKASAEVVHGRSTSQPRRRAQVAADSSPAGHLRLYFAARRRGPRPVPIRRDGELR